MGTWVTRHNYATVRIHYGYTLIVVQSRKQVIDLEHYCGEIKNLSWQG